MGKRPSLLSPHVERYLLADEGEFVVDEVVKHSVCMIVPVLISLAGIALMVVSVLASVVWPLLFFPGLIVSFFGLWKYHARSMERFVVTNMRVFRVTGIVNRHVETMPLTRILDISFYQPMLGMIFDYGHFTFESAANQGLRRITYVGDPNERNLTIQKVIKKAGQRVIKRAGTRAVAPKPVKEDDGT